MKLFTSLALTILIWAWLGIAVLAEDKGQSRSSSANINEIHSDPHGILIQADNVALGEFLNRVTRVTGIQFFVPDDLAQERVIYHLQATHWKDALRNLLEDYSRIELWDEDLSRSSIRLLGNRRASKEIASGSAFKKSNAQKTLKKSTAQISNKNRQSSWKCFSLTGNRKC